MSDTQRGVAVVTGAGTGIGYAITTMLADGGWTVVACGRRRDVLDRVAAAIGERVIPRSLDVTDRAAVLAAIDSVEREVGAISLLVCAAGINVVSRSLVELDPGDWDRILATNATGVFNSVHAVLPQMRSRRDGLIVIISSVAGTRALPLAGPAYVAAKFAANSFGIAAAAELGGEGIRVSNIAPGEVNTPILDQRAEPVSHERRMAMLQPEDVAEAVRFIVSLPPRAHVAQLNIKPTSQIIV